MSGLSIRLWTDIWVVSIFWLLGISLLQILVVLKENCVWGFLPCVIADSPCDRSDFGHVHALAVGKFSPKSSLFLLSEDTSRARLSAWVIGTSLSLYLPDLPGGL